VSVNSPPLKKGGIDKEGFFSREIRKRLFYPGNKKKEGNKKSPFSKGGLRGICSPCKYGSSVNFVV